MASNLPTKLAAVGATLLILSPISSSAQNFPEMNLRYAHPFPPAMVQAQFDDWFAKEIEKRSGGKIKIRIFWSQQLGQNMEMLELVGSGAVEIGSYVPSFFSTRLPLSSVANALPLAFDSARQAQTIQSELFELVPEMHEEVKRARIWPIVFHGVGNFRILCTKPVSKLEDFKNLRVRSYGEHVPKLWASLGAIGVTTLPPEVYEGLHRGKLDCAYFPWDLHYAFRLYEVAKYASTADFGAITGLATMVNYDMWHSKWPANVKKLFMDVARDTGARDRKLNDSMVDAVLTQMNAKHGVNIVKFSDQEKLTRIAPDFLSAWVSDMEKKGLGAQAKKVADHWRKRRAEIK